MLHSVSEFKKFGIAATDGDIGEVENVYFDDEKWTVRYLVVDTGKWLPGRKVVLSPLAVTRTDWDKGSFHVNLTKKQVEESPSIDTELPVSRQQESLFHDYYRYPYYWTGPFIWGPVALPRETAAWSASQADEIRAAAERQQSQDSHLRSANEVNGYYIEASDGSIGHIDDFLLDDDSWTVRYLVVDTRNWWPGKKVVVSPEWVSRVSWPDKTVYVDLSRDQIKKSPEFDSTQRITRDYETALHRHYDRREYWTR